MVGLQSINRFNFVIVSAVDDFDDDDFYYDDIDLINDLGTPSDAFVGTEIRDADLLLIHQDLQLLIMTILLIYIVFFVLFIVRKWR